jgi:hypothetical protein
MIRLTLVLSVVLLVLVIAVVSWQMAHVPTTPQADSFHFTVTADMRHHHNRFGNLLQAINDGPGPGVFHVSIGDIDHTIPENRALIDYKFGTTAIWYPIIGNHEAHTPDDKNWLRTEYNTGHNGRTALKFNTNQDCPAGSVGTTYSWDYGNAHFIALNQYWDGGTAPGSDNATDGDIVPALYNWLAMDLTSNTKPFVFVFGHEPAFPYTRHVGSSLNQYAANRDAFWSLLEAEDVQAFFCGHTHYYSKHQGDKNHIGGVWQLDVGNAGRNTGDGLTYFDVVVGSNQATVNVYRDGGTGIFSLAESVSLLFWESYSDSGHNTHRDSFSGYSTERVAYMYGTGFTANHSYKVAYYDGNGNNPATEAVMSDASGSLSSYHTFVDGTGIAGTWHVIVCDAAYNPPSTYDATWTNTLLDDSFTLQE